MEGVTKVLREEIEKLREAERGVQEKILKVRVFSK